MADAVVVGGGSAGCVLAARLSEDAACQVVLLEAGQDLAGLADVPPDVLDASGPTLAHDWGYQTEPDPLGQRRALPRARLIGDARPRTAASSCAAHLRTMTAGRSWATRAGALRRCCRSSAAWRPMPTSAAIGTAATARLRSAATRAPSSIRYRRRSSTPPARAACRMPPITTGRSPSGWGRCPATHAMECG
jgi:glycine/D-amino acid oxidase-like deaminating enzyme